MSALAWSPDDSRLASAAIDDTIRIWDTTTGTLLDVIQNADVYTRSIAWSPDGTRLAYGGANDTVQIVDAPPAVTCTVTIAAGDVPGLISAITSANGSSGVDTICLSEGSYTLTTVNNTTDGPNGLPSITSAMALVGLGTGATLTRDTAAPAFRLLHVASGGNLTVEKLTLSNGNIPGTSGNGGAVRSNGTLTLRDCTLSNNSAGNDGGALNSAGSLTVSTCTFSTNSATDDGGALNHEGTASASVSTSTFTSNSAADSGGAVYNVATLTVNGSTFSTNTAGDDGGALHNSGTLTLSGGTFSTNSTQENGGGLYNVGTLTVTDATFSGNSALDQGGAVHNNSSAANAVHSTCISGNTAPNGGGGVFSATVNFDATNNWWGAASGPSGAGPGSGDAVNNRVVFNPFITSGCPH